jgi:hypothetical protein
MRVTLVTSEGQQVEYRSGSGFKTQKEMPCLRCGVCCTKWQPPLDSREARAIARALNMPYETFLNKYLQKYPLRADSYLVRRKENACIFLRFENGLASCLIHEHKPEACRNWKPGLEKPECQEGLRKRKNESKLLTLSDLPLSAGELTQFYGSLKSDNI